MARRGQRGAATVEMAISMIVIVPTFLYALFLDDILRYRLDLEEAVTSTAWDYAPADYANVDGGFSGSSIDLQARLMWCDHSSAYDSYDHQYDCDDAWHHTALGAHVCWLQHDAHQITCDQPQSGIGASYSDPAATSFAGSYTKGGMIGCWGTEAVLNYLLPQELFQEFSRDVMTNRKTYRGNVHANATGAGDLDVYLLKGLGPRADGQQPKFGIVVDPWALNDGWGPGGDGSNIEPGQKSGGFYDRVNTVYGSNSGSAQAVMDATQLMTQILSGMKLGPTAFSDTPMQPNLTSLHTDVSSPRPQDASEPPQSSIQEASSSTDYYVTPWLDWDQDEPQATWHARGGYYLGHSSPGSDN